MPKSTSRGEGYPTPPTPERRWRRADDRKADSWRSSLVLGPLPLSRPQNCPQGLGNLLRLLDHLPVAKAQDFIAALSQREVAGSIVLECIPSTVVSVAVGFDDQTLIGPEEVDLERANPHVDLRRREAMQSAEPQKHALELAAGAIGDGLFDLKAEHAGLANRPS